MVDHFISTASIEFTHQPGVGIRRLPYHLTSPTCTLYTDELRIKHIKRNQIHITHVPSEISLPVIRLSQKQNLFTIKPLDLFFVTNNKSSENDFISLRSNNIEIGRGDINSAKCDIVSDELTSNFAFDNALSSTTSKVLIEKLVMPIDIIDPGLFNITWYYEWSSAIVQGVKSKFVKFSLSLQVLLALR